METTGQKTADGVLVLNAINADRVQVTKMPGWEMRFRMAPGTLSNKAYFTPMMNKAPH
jgi:hypothetical protein